MTNDQTLTSETSHLSKVIVGIDFLLGIWQCYHDIQQTL